MKNNKYIVILTILLILSIFVIYKYADPSAPSETETASRKETSDPSQPRGTRRNTADDHEAGRPERERTNTDIQPGTKPDPLNKESFSSTVNIEIAAGETLVTGGYQRANGQYELTFLTPTTLIEEDGSESIRLSSKVLAVDPAFVDTNGLGTLTTKTRNSLQHAEAWNKNKMMNTLKAASQNNNSGIISAPSILAKPGTPATLSMERAGRTRYSIESTVEKVANGGFVIKAVVQRTSLAPVDNRAPEKQL